MITLTQAAEICQAGRIPPIETIPTIIDQLLNPHIPDTDKTNYLIALKERRETPEELAAFALALRTRSTPPPPTLLALQTPSNPFLDSCGTGGGALPLFNVSTAVAILAAAAGISVTKHGNRAITKTSGSTDVLEALGIRTDLTPQQTEAQLRATRFAFLFAPHWHPAFKTLAPLRKQLAASGHRTIFNLLGPLLNPLRPRIQILGVFRPEHGPLFHQALQTIQCPHHAVLYATLPDGRPCGEASPYGTTQIWTSHPSPISIPQTLPHPANIQNDLRPILVQNASQSAALIEAVFKGENQGPAKQFIIINTAIALTLAQKAPDPSTACALASQIIDSGAAWHTLQTIRHWQAQNL